MWASAPRWLIALLVVYASLARCDDRCASKHTPKVEKCTGCPPMYKGKLCASTTRYNDQTKAACGCGETDPVPKDWWTLTKYTAAMDCKNLDPVHPFNAWCPTGCGACYRLCSTGGSMHGHRPKEGVCRVFKITNRCGDGFKEYPMWCSNNLSAAECEAQPHVCKQMHSTNHYGYPAHFDLQDFHHQILDGLGWDNVEVTFEAVPCSSHWEGQDWNCYCDSFEGEKGTGSHHGSGHSDSHHDSNSGHSDAHHDSGKDTSNTDSDLGAERHSDSTDHNSGDCGKEWEQCGGRHFKGKTCCQDGCYCEHLGERGNEHYSHQCVPAHWSGCKYSADNGITRESKFETVADGAGAEAEPSALLASPLLLAAASLSAAALALGLGTVRLWRRPRSCGTLLLAAAEPEDPAVE